MKDNNYQIWSKEIIEQETLNVRSFDLDLEIHCIFF